MKPVKFIFSGLSLAGSVLSLALIAMPSSAATPPELSVSVTGYGSVTVDSSQNESYTGSCSASNCAGTVLIGNGSNGLQSGQIRWTGTIGTFKGSFTGTSNHLASLPQLDLLGTGLQTGADPVTVTVEWTDIGFTLGATPATMNLAGGEAGQSFTSYVDNTNAAFGTGTPVNTLTAPATVTGPGPTASPFSMTDIATLNIPAGVGTDVPPYGFDLLFNDAPAVLTVDCSSLTAGLVGTPYAGSVIASGGVAPYSYTVSGGSLSPLLLNISTGAITGTPTVAGNLNFTAQVVDSSGNSATNTATSACTITVTTPNNTPPTGIGKDDTATIGFWHNKNGQGIIVGLNGGPSSTSLGNWLASNFPYLYGVHSTNNLTNMPNTAVATLFTKLFGASGQKTQAQILAGALASYVTSTTLTGLPGSVGFGFNSSPGGTGARTINVGSNGAAIGLSNNTSYTVLQLLNQVNADTQSNGGSLTTAEFNAFNVIFSNINQTGDIS